MMEKEKDTQSNTDEARALVEQLIGFIPGQWTFDMFYQWFSNDSAAPPSLGRQTND